ncbi:nitrate- and nitrite sensing domain-containing protein [Nocardiopsis flavescens]
MRRTRVKASTIRGQLTRIVLVPSLCFLALWLVVAAVGTVQAVRLMGSVAQAREGTEAFSAAVLELRSERRLGLVQLGRLEAGGDLDTQALAGQRSDTDTALADAVGLAEQLTATRDDEVRRSAEAFIEAVADLPALRNALDEGSAVQEQLLVGYGEVLDDATAVTTALVHTTDGGENLTDAVLTSELLGAATEYSTADALLAGVAARGAMGYEETAHFTYLTASYRDTLGGTADLLSPAVRARHEEMVSDGAWARAEDISRGVVTRPPAPAAGDPGQSPSPEWNTAVDVDGDDWAASSGTSVALLDGVARAQADRTVDLAWSAALTQVSLGVGASLVCLLGGAAALFSVGRSSRRLTDRLTLLRERVMERDDDLPDIVDRAQRGDRVDAQEELPPLNEFGDDEIGQVAEAFDSAQLTAVEAAVRQAEIRRGANKAFLGIAFRNQNLVQRQLRLLDEIEYDEQDPDALGRLFRLDHLTTRARRYADNLIILGGGQSARRWRQPRPLVDVLRAAIAETEDFERVRLTSAPRLLMHGQAVADIVHLLAELIENATQFSPVGTPVDVGCGPCPEGLLVEVEDRGLGMSEHGYEQARRTLARPPEFDVMALPDDPRLGLFVVARLAERHGVRVWLEPSPYGGTRAITLIPRALLEPAEAPAVVGPRGVVPAAARPREGAATEGDVRPAFGLPESRAGAAASGARPERDQQRWAEPEDGPGLRPVVPEEGVPVEPGAPAFDGPVFDGVLFDGSGAGPATGPQPAFEAGPVGPRTEPAADSRPAPGADAAGPRPGHGLATGPQPRLGDLVPMDPRAGTAPADGPGTDPAGTGDTGPRSGAFPGTGPHAVPGAGPREAGPRSARTRNTGPQTFPGRGPDPRRPLADAPGDTGPRPAVEPGTGPRPGGRRAAGAPTGAGPRRTAAPRPAAEETPYAHHPVGDTGEVDLFADAPPADGPPAAERRRPRHSAPAPADGPQPGEGPRTAAAEGPWDVRWGRTGPQEALGDVLRPADPPRTGPRREPAGGGPQSAPGDRPRTDGEGRPGDPTEPLPHLAVEHRRSGPGAASRPGAAHEGARPAQRRDLPPGFTGPRPVTPGQERPSRAPGPWADRAPAEPPPAPDGARTDGAVAPAAAGPSHGAPGERARGAGPTGPDGAPDQERTPLPKRPATREQDAPRVPAPTPPGGHSEP